MNGPTLSSEVNPSSFSVEPGKRNGGTGTGTASVIILLHVQVALCVYTPGCNKVVVCRYTVPRYAVLVCRYAY